MRVVDAAIQGILAPPAIMSRPFRLITMLSSALCFVLCSLPAHCGAPVVHSSPDHAKDSEVQPTHNLVHPAPSSCHGLIMPKCMSE